MREERRFVLLALPHPSRMLAMKALESAEDGMEVLIQWPKKKRKVSLNDAMWAGPLKDIEKQARYPHPNGALYDAKIWHEFFKEKFLPDETDPDFNPEHVLADYHKWRYNPFKDTRELAGSTTNLTDKGMRAYLLAMESEAAQEFQVTFTEASEPSGRCRD